MVEKDLRVLLIFEMLGRPAEHLQETLKTFVEKLGSEKGIKIINKNFNEPKQVGNPEHGLFTSFVEVESEFKDLQTLIGIVFAYMPSHVEIISPEYIEFKNFQLNTIISELLARLHQYDELTKGVAIERGIFAKKLHEMGVDLKALLEGNILPPKPENKSKPEKKPRKSKKK